MKLLKRIDPEFAVQMFCRLTILITIGATLALASCARTIAPHVIHSSQPSLDVHGNPTSGILQFQKDGITADQHWMDRYHMMVNLNAQKPDMVNGKPNPNKVFIVGKEDMDVVDLKNGTYHVSYITLSYFDRLNQAQKANRKVE